MWIKKTNLNNNRVQNWEPAPPVFGYRWRGCCHCSRVQVLGTIIDNKLQWNRNTDTIYKKGLQRLYFMQRLRQFRVNRDLFCCVVWYFSLSVTNKNRLSKIVNLASKVSGEKLDSVAITCKRRMLKKGQAINKDMSHPLHQAYEVLPSGRRFSLPYFQTNQASKSFIPSRDGN